MTEMKKTSETKTKERFRDVAELDEQNVLLLWDGNEVSGEFYPGSDLDEPCSVVTRRVKSEFHYCDIDEISIGDGELSIIKLLPE